MKHIVAVTLVCVMSLLFLSACTDNSNAIRVITPMSKRLMDFNEIGVAVEHWGEGHPESNNAHNFNSEIFFLLKDLGKQWSRKQNNEVIIYCNFEEGFGPPRPTAAGPIFFSITYVDSISIRIVETQSGNTIGEVEYVRSHFHENPPYMVKSMLEALLATEME